MTPHQDECAAAARVLTADSASCFFLAMSVAELFLCSSSSLRGRKRKVGGGVADANDHPLGFTVEAVHNVSNRSEEEPRFTLSQ